MPPYSTSTQTLPHRRRFFNRTADGLLGTALLALSGSTATRAKERGHSPTGHPSDESGNPHYTPRARSVIQLFMNGGPSQMDLFDPKPMLTKHHGEAYFSKIAGEVENPQSAGALMQSPFKFAQHGESGMWVSDALPHLSKCTDDLALIRSMHAPSLTHEPALYKIHSGSLLPGYPSLGSWVTYGLGSENENLPAYIVLDDPRGLPINRTQNWQAGFLPPQFQGTRFRSTGSPVLDLQRGFEEPDGITQMERQFREALDGLHLETHPGQPRLQARMKAYALAARMQLSASDALDLSQESEAIHDLYGIGQEPTDSYGRRCLYARRLVERGVRFVQLFIDNQIWDNHTDLAGGLKGACERTDRPIAALLKDLKQRGLLDSTLVIWGGEFGRLPIAQLPGDKDASNAGRDHNKNAMVTWMAGGGVRGGISHGSTDDLGLAVANEPVSVEDWHATILHLLGLHHQKLAYPRNGLDERITGVSQPRVVDEILA